MNKLAIWYQLLFIDKSKDFVRCTNTTWRQKRFLHSLILKDDRSVCMYRLFRYRDYQKHNYIELDYRTSVNK